MQNTLSHVDDRDADADHDDHDADHDHNDDDAYHDDHDHDRVGCIFDTRERSFTYMCQIVANIWQNLPHVPNISAPVETDIFRYGC